MYRCSVSSGISLWWLLNQLEDVLGKPGVLAARNARIANPGFSQRVVFSEDHAQSASLAPIAGCASDFIGVTRELYSYSILRPTIGRLSLIGSRLERRRSGSGPRKAHNLLGLHRVRLPSTPGFGIVRKLLGPAALGKASALSDQGVHSPTLFLVNKRSVFG